MPLLPQQTADLDTQLEDASPHDRILGSLFQKPNASNKNDSAPRASVLDTSNAISDPFDGTFLGSILSPDRNVQPEEGGKLSDIAAKNEELWSHLSSVLELQNQISRMHLDMEEIGLNADPKGRGKGTRSRATSISRVVIDDVEGDEGIGKRDEEAEREEQFSNLAGQFRGKKEAITAIMSKLDSLSSAVTEFHALQAPQIDFLSSRDNSIPASNAVENQPVDIQSQFNPVRKSSLPPNVLKRVADPTTPVLSESPLSIEMPLPP